jgi:hypothetical protein
MKTRLAHYAEGELNLYLDVLMKLTHISFFYAIGAVIPSIKKLLFVDFVTLVASRKSHRFQITI